tara:strand:+ start:20070 stop:22451 length:2382 start_codon:yes stop_codon:yes gene_type:complete
MNIPVISRLFAKSDPTSMPNIPSGVETQPKQRELAWTSPSFFHIYGGRFETYNPDQLAAKKGSGIYRKMLRDPQVKSAFNLVLDIMVSRTYRFDKPDDSPLQEEISQFFDYQINEFISGTWLQAMRAILLAKAHGFSVSEKVYKVGEWQGNQKWLVKAIKPKPYETFTFENDVYGNISKIIQEQDNDRKTLDPNKFIIFVSYPEIDPVYGESDLRACYRAYWEKDNILKFRNIYLERSAGGFWIANPSEEGGSLSTAEEADFKKMLENVTATTAMMVPRGWKVDLEHGFNTEAYEKAAIHCDKQIAKALMVPNLLGFSEQGTTGALAQSKTQLETFFRVIDRQGGDLADTLNEQFFKELAWWNYGVKQFPRFTFETLTTAEKREVAEAWIIATEKGVVINTVEDENRTRELLQYDARDPETELLNPPVEPEPAPKLEEFDDNEYRRLVKNIDEIIDDTTSHRFKESAPLWVGRTNFVDIEKSLDEDEDSFFTDLAKDIDSAFSEIKRKIKEINSSMPEKDKVNIQKEVRKMDDAISKETKSNMKETVRIYLRQSYKRGRKAAQKELKSASKNMSEIVQDRIKISIDYAQRKAIDPITQEGVSNFEQGLGIKTADKVFAEKSFKITGDLTEEMVSKAKQVILNGIQNELSVDEMIEQLQEVLPTLVGKIDEETGQIDQNERSRLETIVRTNVLDAFNQARMSVFTDPDLDNFVEALQFSAILDSRTTEICRRYDGRIFSLDDQIWKALQPPLHFSCRSVLIAITAVDEWTESSKARHDDGTLVQPGAGFGNIKE